jgi:hypothetical protein
MGRDDRKKLANDQAITFQFPELFCQHTLGDNPYLSL